MIWALAPGVRFFLVSAKHPLGAPCKSVPARAGPFRMENPITQTHLASPLPQNPFDSQQILLGIHPDRIERSMRHMDTDSFLQQPQLF
jgi:hypothetical protein